MRRAILAMVAGGFLLGNVPAHSDDVVLPRAVIAGGGGVSDGGHFEVHGTIAQSTVGRTSRNSFTLTSGFWFEEPPGDCDEDGTTSILDYSALNDCLDGPASDLLAGCECIDFDSDGHVDLFDFARFQNSFAGK
ncbi:MAG: hypothetical protein HY287_03815 [Planctomycetes bacterium]|nr:hypothetical protein [Planctomycetota bacterium]MBI3833439.1 hypothetical protein [Planctomycetota bacterium]